MPDQATYFAWAESNAIEEEQRILPFASDSPYVKYGVETWP